MSFFGKKPLLDKQVQEQVAACIADAERGTTGEIRVFVESHCAYVNPLERCAEVFAELGMHQTINRNGVLLYLAMKDKQFAIAGDSGINEKIGGNDYWQKAAHRLRDHLKEGLVAEGICLCVKDIGASLAAYFPHDGTDNPNELPDEIVFGS